MGGRGRLKVFSGEDSTLLINRRIMGQHYEGGLRVGAIDVNGDGVPEVLGGPTPDETGVITIVDATTEKVLNSFVAFDPAFTGGLFIATGR